MSKRYRGISDSQADAEAHNRRALEQRERPLSETHASSVQFNWDYTVRVPSDLRGMVRAARRAYEDEVPTKLHDADIGEGGTPRMAAGFVRYMDSPEQDDDQRKCISAGMKSTRKPCKPDPDTGRVVHSEACQLHPANRPLVSHYLTPFRAQMERMLRAGHRQARRARIVGHITIGSQEPAAAALSEGAHLFDASLSAEDALRVFLRGMSDLKVHVRTEEAA